MNQQSFTADIVSAVLNYEAAHRVHVTELMVAGKILTTKAYFTLCKPVNQFAIYTIIFIIIRLPAS